MNTRPEIACEQVCSPRRFFRLQKMARSFQNINLLTFVEDACTMERMPEGVGRVVGTLHERCCQRGLANPASPVITTL